jgi:radical SAM superfamily enzyme YgiQ (UPF0313 family)
VTLAGHEQSTADTNLMSPAEAIEAFRSVGPGHGLVQIVRPCAVISRNSYSAPVTPPIGPAYLAAVLEGAGYEVGLIDAIGEAIAEVRPSESGEYNIQGLSTTQILERIDPRAAILGVSMMFSQEWVFHRELIRAVRKRFPDIVIVVGGEHPTALPEWVLRDCPEIDYLVVGEGEITFLQLVSTLLSSRTAEGIPGVWYLGESGAVVSGPPRARISALDELPRPAWHLCRVDHYFIDNWTMGIAKGRNMPILATRGCPYRCAFCSSCNMWTTRYVTRDPRLVVDEIQWLVETYQANSIDFFDLTAIVKRDWILAFCRELVDRRLGVVYQLPSGTRSEVLDAETLRALKDSGCEYLVYAPESGSERILESIKKRISLSRMTESIRTAAKLGHVVKVNLIIGFPEERLSDALKTIRYAVSMGLHGVADCNITLFSPYPGSQVYEEMRAEGVLGEPNDEYFRRLVVQFDFTSSVSYCKRVAPRTLATLRFVGLSLFYVFAYLSTPRRLVRLMRSASSERFQPYNLFEQRIYDFWRRRQLKRDGR